MTLPVIQPLLVPMDACMPSNDRLLSAAGPMVREITGALGGLTIPIALGVTVLIGLLALFTVVSHRGREYVKLLPLPFVIVIGMILAIMFGTAIITIMNNSC